MIGNSGAAAKVETKQVKKEIHERRKVRMYGLANEKSLKDSALFFESTGSENFLAAASRWAPASTSISSPTFLC
jgi:hypothetical protein